MEIHQIVPSLCNNDAVGNYVIEIRKLLLNQGYVSNIYAKYSDPEVSKYSKELFKYKGNSRNIILYHMAIGGGDVTYFVKNLPDRKILIYHNITPAVFFSQYNQELQHLCYQGLEEINEIKDTFHLAITVSEYNEMCLKELGYLKTAVVPILMDINPSIIDQKIEISTEKYSKCTINIIFVGRISPHKKIEDIILAFYYYNFYINPDSRLFLIGKIQFPTYYYNLCELIKKLQITNAVVFTGEVTEEEKRRYYEISHIFLCMSEHEGFCVPLLEAMQFKIPVIAYNSTAIPGTLGDAGILINKKNYVVIAEIINILINDCAVRNRIIQKQNERVKFFDKEVVGRQIIEKIESLVNDYD